MLLTIGSAVFAFAMALAAVAVLVTYLTDPERRVKSGQVLSALYDENGVTHSCLAPDAKCGTCGRGNVNTLVRNRFQRDMPVCQGCLAYYNDSNVVSLPVRTPRTTRPLDAPDVVGKPMPRF